MNLFSKEQEKKKKKESINLVTRTTTKKKIKEVEEGWCRLADVSRTTCEGLRRLASAEATGTEAPSLDGSQC